MKYPINFVAVFLFLVATFTCDVSHGMIRIKPLTKEAAKDEYGIIMHTAKNGDAGIKVWIQFKQEGPMKEFVYAELQMEDSEGNHLLKAQLEPNPAHHRQPEETTTVAFSAAPDQLNRFSFLVVCSDGIRGHRGYLLRVKDFLNLTNQAIGGEKTRKPTSGTAPGDDDNATGDGLPTGNSTPEGAATDLVRAFLERDYNRFDAARTRNSCEGRNDSHNYYAFFLQHTTFVNDFGNGS